MQSTSPENAADIEAMSAALEATSVGSLCTYAALSDAIGRDCRERQWLLRSAIKQAEQNTGGLFATVRGEGIKRLASDELPNVGADALRKTRRTARRAIKRMEGVRANDLPQEEAQKMLAYRAQLGAVSMISDGRKTPALVNNSDGSVLPVGRVLELFKAG